MNSPKGARKRKLIWGYEMYNAILAKRYESSRSRNLALVLAVSLVLPMLMFNTSKVSAFSGSGSGTSGDPYIITTVDQLQEMNDNLTAYYILGNDIDATATHTWNDNGDGGYYGFEPIGTLENRFTGTLDGQGYAISNLYINRPDNNDVGLFGYVGSTGVVENVGIENANLDGYEYVGSLVGSNRGIVSNSYSTGVVSGYWGVGGLVGFSYSSGTVSDSYSISTVSSDWAVGGLVGYNEGTVSTSHSTSTVSNLSNDYTGGLVGYNYGGTVSKSYSTGAVSGGWDIGGLIGLNQNATVSYSYSTGAVSGSDDFVGGLVGRNSGTGTVSNAYSTGTVSGNWSVGGLVGYLTSGTVSNAYSTGTVNGSLDVGGLVGFYESGTISNSFWDNQTSGQSTSAGGTGKTTENMKNVRTFTDTTWSVGLTSPWGFVDNYDAENNAWYQTTWGNSVDVWDIDPAVNDGYPFLTGLLSTPGQTYPELQVGTWDETYDNYYTGENENNADGELKLALAPVYENGMKLNSNPVNLGTMSAGDNVSIRFTAQESKTVDNIRFYVSSRTTGTTSYNMGIQADNGDGYPDGIWLDNLVATITAVGWKKVNLPDNVALTAGNIYHIVVNKITGTALLSLGGLNTLTGIIPFDGRVDDNANTLYYNGTWTVKNYDPIYVLDYTDGTYRGQPYAELNGYTIYLTEAEGERFTIGENKLLTKVGVWMKKVGTPADSLYIVLYDNTSGENEFVLTATSDEFSTSYAWVTKEVSPAVQLVAGHTYYLYYKSPGSLNSSNCYNDYEVWTSATNPYFGLTYYGDNSILIYSTDGGVTWSGTEYNYYDIAFYVELGTYYNNAYIESSIFDAGGTANWENVSWSDNTPTGTSIIVRVRSGNTENSYDGSWSDWCQHDNNTENASLPNNRYAQYRIELSASDNSQTPVLYDILLDYILPPTQPTLVSPADGTFTNDNTPTFVWNIGTGADNHRLLVDNDSDFSSPEENQLLGADNNSYTPSTALPAENYSWKVIAINTAGENASSVWTFAIDITAPDQVTLVSPSAGENTNDATPDFSWDAVTDNSVTYELQVDDNQDFSTPVYNKIGISGTTHTSENTLTSGTYYWRVRAKDAANNYGQWSDNRQLTIDTIAPSAPTITSPNDGENTSDSTPTITWNAVSENSLPVLYQVVIDNDSDFSSPENDSDWINAASYTPGALIDNLYYLRVRAIDNAGNVGENSQRTFRVDTLAPVMPTITAPADGENTNDNTPTITWNAISENSLPVLYQVIIDNDSDFSSSENDSGWISATNYTPGNLLDNLYYLRVRAMDNAGNVGENSQRTFRVDTLAPSAPTITAPVDNENISDNTPTVTWSAVSENSLLVLYQVIIDNDSNFSSAENDSGWISAITYTPGALPDNLYYLRVHAMDNAGNVGENSQITFRVDTLAPVAPTITFPAVGENTSDNTPTITWNAVNDNSTPVLYQVVIDNNSDFSSSENDSDWISATNYTSGALLDNSYYLRVRAMDNAGNIGENSQLTFRVDTLAPAAPTITYPAAGENTSDNTPAITWNAVSDNSLPVLYQVVIDNDSDFSSPENDSGWISGTSYTPGTLQDNFYYLRVGAKDNAGNVGENAQLIFRVDTIMPAAPTLHIPENNFTVATATPTFGWENIIDNSGVTYRLVIDNDNDYSSPIYNKSGITENQHTIENSLTNATYYWRARAVDGATNVGDWSDNFKLIIQIATPSPPVPPSPTPPPVSSFRLAVAPESGSVQQGSSTTATVSLTALEGYSSVVTPSASQPSGILVSFSPSSGVPDFSSTMTVIVSSAPVGSHWIYLQAVGADGTRQSVGYSLSVTAAWENIEVIEAGENGDFDFGDYLPVSRIRISAVRRIENVAVSVEVLPDRPTDAPQLTLRAYFYLNITTTASENDIGGVIISFKVLKSWVEQNNIDESTIKLLKLNGVWHELPTRATGEDASYLYFEATGTEFLLFAIAGEQRAVLPPPLVLLPPFALLISSALISLGGLGGGMAFYWRYFRSITPRISLKRLRQIRPFILGRFKLPVIMPAVSIAQLAPVSITPAPAAPVGSFKPVPITTPTPVVRKKVELRAMESTEVLGRLKRLPGHVEPGFPLQRLRQKMLEYFEPTDTIDYLKKATGPIEPFISLGSLKLAKRAILPTTPPEPLKQRVRHLKPRVSIARLMRMEWGKQFPRVPTKPVVEHVEPGISLEALNKIMKVEEQ